MNTESWFVLVVGYLIIGWILMGIAVVIGGVTRSELKDPGIYTPIVMIGIPFWPLCLLIAAIIGLTQLVGMSFALVSSPEKCAKCGCRMRGEFCSKCGERATP